MIASRLRSNASAIQKEKQTQSTFLNLSLWTAHLVASTPFIVTLHGGDISTFGLSLTLRSHALPSLVPHNRQYNCTSSKENAQRHTKTPHGFRLEALSLTAARPSGKTHHRAAFLARRECHCKCPC